MADNHHLERLAAGVGAAPDELTAFDGLKPDELKVLIEGFEHAQKRQRAELEAGIEEAIGYVPALMRRPVLRVLRGKDDK